MYSVLMENPANASTVINPNPCSLEFILAPKSILVRPTTAAVRKPAPFSDLVPSPAAAV